MILLIRTGTDEYTAEAHTLTSDETRRVLHFHGTVDQEQTLKDALLSYAASRGIRLAEGFVVQKRDGRRITVSAVTLNENGFANATRRNGHWVAYLD